MAATFRPGMEVKVVQSLHEEGEPTVGHIGTVDKVEADGTVVISFDCDEEWADGHFDCRPEELQATGNCSRCGKPVAACKRLDEFCVGGKN